MNDPSQPSAGDGNSAGAADTHQPFTLAERIHQLSKIDNDITSLLTHLSSAMRAMGTPPGASVRSPAEGTSPASDDDGDASSDPVSAFKIAQTAFVRAVDRIDKHLTRQILALEEAGIITLRNAGGGGMGGEQQNQQGELGFPGVGHLNYQLQQAVKGAAAAPARLEPDGMGRFGGLDVGQLNMASSTVERDMEAELWRKAREHLGQLVGEESDADQMEE